MDTLGSTQKILASLEEASRDFDVIRILANSDTTFRPFIGFTDSLLNRCSVSPQLRELIILRVAQETAARFVVEEHITQAGSIGIPRDTIERARRGDLTSGELSESERLVLDISTRIVKKEPVADSDWDALEAELGPGSAIDVILICGYWGVLMPLVLDTLGFEPSD
jgi:alkylhydroperoxidase family enzyme